MAVVAVGSAAQVSSVFPELGRLLRHPLVTLERVSVCKRDGQPVSRPGEEPAADRHRTTPWQKLTLYAFEGTENGQPVHRTIVRRLRSAGTSGVTVHRGVWGFHGDQAPHGDRFLQRGRRVPVLTTVIDTPGNIPLAFEIIDELTGEQGLITSENILVMREAPALP
jgi:PII-like signaling protein